jgi:hypothetical protein
MRVHGVSVPYQIGSYCYEIEYGPSGRILLFGFRVRGIRHDGRPPEQMEALGEQVWDNVRAALARANNTLFNLAKICSVKIGRYVVSAADIPNHVECAHARSGTRVPPQRRPSYLHLFGYLIWSRLRQLQRMRR